MKKWLAIAILALAFAGLLQWVIGALRRNDFQQGLHQWALRVTGKNDDEISQGVIEAARQINAELRPEDIRIAYKPTDKLSLAQQIVGKIATFENYCATITVEYRQTILFVPVAHRVEAWALIESAAKSKHSDELPDHDQ